MRTRTWNQIKLGAAVLVLFATFLFALTFVGEALAPGDYERRSRHYLARDHPIYLVLLSLGGLVSGGLSVAGAWAIFRARGEERRIDLYLARRQEERRSQQRGSENGGRGWD